MPKLPSPSPRTLRAWLRSLWPAAPVFTRRERLRACAGAALGIFCVIAAASLGLHGGLLADQHQLALAIVAPIGASAVLVFAAPSSPLAQPWAVVGGNTLSALVGIACARWVPEPAVAAALAVGLAIALMIASRSLHPPGGASALLMVIMGAGDFTYAFNPVLLDSLLLVGAGLLYNNLSGRPWPALASAPAASAGRFSGADLDAALRHYNRFVDISREDLQALLEQAEAAAYQRTLGELRCADIMTAQPLTARQDTPLKQAWALMRKHKVKALPVVDRQHHLVGIVTVADFMRQLDLDAHEGVAWHLRSLFKPRGDALALVGDIMSRTVRVAGHDRLLTDLVPVFSETGHRHVPILDAQRRLVGIVTQSDLIKALYAAVRSGAQPGA
ncbi:HPP family protein [Pseudomonas sp. NPDC007930]|uniref:HPP family protein n=1 Tax=Pseudomonas sp. NPDC007930 TaxID=3364417 RepID=UPI0036EC921E